MPAGLSTAHFHPTVDMMPDRGSRQSLQQNADLGHLCPSWTPAKAHPSQTHTDTHTHALSFACFFKVPHRRHKQLLQTSKKKRPNCHCSRRALYGLTVVTRSSSREPLNVSGLQQAGGSVQLMKLNHNHVPSKSCRFLCKNRNAVFSNREGMQQRDFQKKEFWWELMRQLLSRI